MKTKAHRASLGEIARVAGVTTMSASRAISNKPGVSQATRDRILRIAKDLGYAPDPRLQSWMAQVRGTRSKDLLPIAWLNTDSKKDSWRTYRFHTPYMEGARSRALELGFKIEDIWVHEPGMTMKRLSKALYQRCIEGVIVTFPARHIQLDWDHLACVALGGSLLAPRLHRVDADISFNLSVAVRSLKRLGYQRIGICLAHEVDHCPNYALYAKARELYTNASARDRIPPLFQPLYCDKEKETVKWFNRYHPDVIVSHDNRMVQWMETAGYRVPKDVAVANLAIDDDVSDWAGIHSRRREVGSAAVDQLAAMMHTRQFGVPKTPLNILIEGSWKNGWTVIPCKSQKGAISDK